MFEFLFILALMIGAVILVEALLKASDTVDRVLRQVELRRAEDEETQ